MEDIFCIREKTRTSDPEIFKQNNLIECSFKEMDSWSEIHHDLLNEIIAVYQQRDNSKDHLFSEEFKRKLFIRRRTLEKNINIRRKSNNEMFELLKKMRDTSFTVKNIYQSNGYKTTGALAFFERVFLHEHKGKDSYFEIEYSELFAMLCNKDYSLKYGNYSKLNLQKITKIKSKYGKALIEMIESNSYKKRFTLSENDLKMYLKYEVKDYRFSYLVREIKKAYELVNNEIPFEFEEHKRDKSITFRILPLKK